MNTTRNGNIVIGSDGLFFDGDSTLPQQDERQLAQERYNELAVEKLRRDIEKLERQVGLWERIFNAMIKGAK